MLHQVRALSMDRHFKEMIGQSTAPILIHSVFTRTINIIVKNQLYTIASNQLDNAPATLLIELDNFNSYRFLPDDRVRIRNEQLKLTNKLSIDLSATHLWKKEISHFPIKENQLHQNLLYATAFVLKMGKTDWLREDSEDRISFQKEMGRMLRERTAGLMQNFERSTLTEQVKRTEGIIGLGQGLTPSGDDFLVGVMLAFSTLKKDLFNKRKWASQVVNVSKEKTNAISYSALKYAAIGETRESIYSFIHALFTGSEEAIERELLAVLKIGSSSGTEITWGILNGLTLILKQEDYNDNSNKNKKEYLF